MRICSESVTVVEYFKKKQPLYTKKSGEGKAYLCIILHTIHSVLRPLAIAGSPVNVKLHQPVDSVQRSSLHHCKIKANHIIFVVKSPFKLERLSQVFYVIYSSLHAAMLLQIILNGTLLQYAKIDNKCIKT